MFLDMHATLLLCLSRNSLPSEEITKKDALAGHMHCLKRNEEKSNKLRRARNEVQLHFCSVVRG